MMCSFKYFQLILVFSVFVNVLNALESDLIDSLPGLQQKPSFRQYSGYLNATEGRHLFYWFFESQKNATHDPLLLWLNGGPGCSSIEGLLTENGPFRVSSDGNKLTYDEYSWNSLANVLYIESPAGVGFSYDENNTTKTGDFDTLKYNFEALKDFFEKFPQFSKNDFYITGESYAGVYIPTLATKILSDQNSKINLKGIAIGNGLYDLKIQSSSRLQFAHYHGFIDTQTWDSLTLECCSCKSGQQLCEFPIISSNYSVIPLNSNEKCTQLMKTVLQDFLLSGIDPYNVLDSCNGIETNSTSTQNIRNTRYYTTLKLNFPQLEIEDILGNRETDYFAEDKQTHECVSRGYYEYLKKPEVLKALHVSAKANPWIECNSEILMTYAQQYPNMKEQFQDLIHKYKLNPIIIYNGDVDMICDFMGNEIFLDGLKLPVLKNTIKWNHNGITAGFVKRYQGLTFTTIRGAGHMAPTQKPGPCLRVIEELIGKSKLN